MSDVRPPIAHRQAFAGRRFRLPPVTATGPYSEWTPYAEGRVDLHLHTRSDPPGQVKPCPVGSVVFFVYPGEREHHPAFHRHRLQGILAATPVGADYRPSTGGADACS